MIYVVFVNFLFPFSAINSFDCTTYGATLSAYRHKMQKECLIRRLPIIRQCGTSLTKALKYLSNTSTSFLFYFKPALQFFKCAD
jgi:hypothetical protein